MAKKNQVFIDVVVDDKGTTKRVAVNAKALGIELERTGTGADRATKGTDRLNKNTKELDRNMKGASKQSANSTKNFSKMQQGMGGLVGAYATLAAQVFAVSAAFQFLSEASQLRNLIAGQEALGAVTGTAYKTISNSIIEATDSQLKYADAAKAAAIGTAAGLTAGQLTELGSAAKNASFALGRDLTDSFNRLVRGVTKAEPELLDELGIILRLETATRKYALEIGKSVGDLDAFERTQAVANDVLDQAVDKFEAIEAQMDPSAATLAQFTKSFDNLLNSFKTGVLEAVIPVLGFLSKNTMALVAALSLVAVPIIKSILPSMDEWAKSSKKKMKQTKKETKALKKDIKAQEQAILDLVATQESSAKRAQEIAQQKGGAQGVGMSFLTGSGAGTKKEAAAARKILEAAEAQILKYREVRSGKLKGYDAAEVAAMRTNYNMREGIASDTTAKIEKFFKRMWFRITLGSKKGLKMWNKTMQGMAWAAQKTAKIINFAMSAIAIVGIVSLIASSLKEFYRWLFPLTEQQKRNIATVEELSEKYKDLGTEMAEARKQRENWLAGSEVSANIGRSVSSADPEELIKNINRIAGMDPGTDKYEDMQTTLGTVVDELGEIDERFLGLKKPLEDGTQVSAEMASELIKVGREAVKLGNTIENMARKSNAAAKSFDSLLKSMVKPTAMTSYLQLENEAQDAAKVTLKDVEARNAADKKALQEAGGLLSVHRSQLEEIRNLPTYGQGNWVSVGGRGKSKQQVDNIIDSDDYDKQRKLIEQAGMTPVSKDKLKTIEQQKVLNDTLKKGQREEVAINEEVEVRKAKLERLGKVQTILLNNAKNRAKVETALVKKQTLGLTIAGKINNLALTRQKIQDKVAEAEDKLEVARAMKVETDIKGTAAQKTAAAEAVKNAEQQVELAKANATLQLAKVNLTERELKFQNAILMRLEAQRRLLSDINRLRKAAAHVQAMGGGSWESEAQARQMRMQANDQAVAAAEEEASLAQAAYNEKFNELRLSAAQTQDAGGALMNINEVRAQAMGTTEGTALTAAQDALTDAKNAQELEAKKSEIMDRQVASQNKMLEMRAQSNFFNQAEQLYLDNVQAKLDLGIGLEEMNLDLMKAQAKEQHELNTLIEMKQDLSNSITSNMESAFMSIVDGSKSAKEAFAQMAKAILADIARMIIKLMIQRAIMAAMGMADGGVTPSPTTVGAAKGGVFGPLKKNSYTSGGIARGPHAGYAATLHGNEAVVPLPHNRKIPVELMGSAGGQQNNVTVNVNMGEGGLGSQAGQGDSNQANQIGDAIAKAVQAELQYQKRSGGILNPYGVA